MSFLNSTYGILKTSLLLVMKQLQSQVDINFLYRRWLIKYSAQSTYHFTQNLHSRHLLVPDSSGIFFINACTFLCRIHNVSKPTEFTLSSSVWCLYYCYYTLTESNAGSVSIHSLRHKRFDVHTGVIFSVEVIYRQKSLRQQCVCVRCGITALYRTESVVCNKIHIFHVVHFPAEHQYCDLSSTLVASSSAGNDLRKNHLPL